MAFEPGGVAGKLGNRFEAKWVIEQFLKLLNEELCSVTVEGIGDDEHGVDLWVVRKDGVREAHQCKARNGATEKWTLGALAGRGVLAYLREQLTRDPTNRFWLVTGVPFTLLDDFCRSLDASGANAPDLVAALKPGSHKDTLFRQFCRPLDLDPTSPAERGKAIDLLRRTRVETRCDTEKWSEDLAGRAGSLIKGDSENALAVIRELVEENLHRPWTTSELWGELEGRGFGQRRLDREDRIRPRVHELQTEYIERVRSRLIDENLIQRPEAEKILGYAKDNAVVVVHGPAGSGKTGVLYQVVTQAAAEGRVVLPVSLDRRVPKCLRSVLGKTSACLTALPFAWQLSAGNARRCWFSINSIHCVCPGLAVTRRSMWSGHWSAK